MSLGSQDVLTTDQRAPLSLNLSLPDSEMGNNDFSNRCVAEHDLGMFIRRLVGRRRHRVGAHKSLTAWRERPTPGSRLLGADPSTQLRWVRRGGAGPRPLLQAALGAELARCAPCVLPPPVPSFPSSSARAASDLPPAAAGEKRAPWPRSGEGGPGFPGKRGGRASATGGRQGGGSAAEESAQPGGRPGGGGAAGLVPAPARRLVPTARRAAAAWAGRSLRSLRPAPRFPHPLPLTRHSAPRTPHRAPRIPTAGHVAAAAAAGAAAEYGREPLPQARRV